MDSINRPIVVPLSIREYVAGDGETPFRLGNLGDHKSVGAGVWEARLFFGPGYRLYFGKANRSTLVLLFGGSKSSQPTDVRRARRLWRDYLEVK